MKTKTIFKMLAAAMLMPAMLLTTACSSDDDAVNDNANTQKKYYEIPVTVTVTRQGDEGTRAVYDSETKTLSFSEGDKLFVNGIHPTTGNFAGVLEFVSATDGTFEGTVRSAQPYTGTAKAFLDDSDIHDVKATLLPAGYTNYRYLRLETYDNITTEAEITQYTIVPNTLADYYNSLLPLGKAEAVAQLSREYANGYSDNGSGKVFALSPQRPVICCTISGLPATTSVSVVYNGYDDGIEISGNITTDGSGTATFAFTDFPGNYLGTLTVNGNAITLPTGVQLAAGKVYNINRSVAPAGVTAYTLAESELGMVVGTDGKAYAMDDKDNLPTGVTAAGVVAYKAGTSGLVIALTDEASTMDWSTACGASGAAAHTPAVEGQSWKLPSQEDWQHIGSVYNGTDLNTAIVYAGGTAILTPQFNPDTQTMTNIYWLSTENPGNTAQALFGYIINGYIGAGDADHGPKTEAILVRAVLAF